MLNKDDDINNKNSDDDWDNWESEIEDTMDDDDIITVNEVKNEISEENNNIIINPTYINQVFNKKKGCLRFCLNLITNYVNRTPASYGGAYYIEVMAKKMFPNKFPYKFTRKKLTTSQKRALNQKIYAESQWHIDKEYNDHTNIWIILADKTIHNVINVFNEKPVFKGLCLYIAAMSDITKLKPALWYHFGLRYIVGSILSIEKIKINIYKDIPIIINDIKIKKAIANDMHAYILQVLLPNFLPIVIVLIANIRSNNQLIVTNFHQELLIQMTLWLNLSILSIGLDSHIVEFKAQTAI
ncbi:hypothetical protein GLOIN_2v1886255 [Rhizophagus irregularis DAOM 181602=DAOM 197198]|uniref:Uncharacterized protein n=1 Tax=Rhizophagus irregularis (strain DAOM 181602 / DAOM 197198 / MUCL 43194) TaxID=747089 RepID=A0A2P4NXN4_RHIID|nr:hypothetical protein GLOIN_2v1886255 [Rhizophagus irregularis DAOM 181602=DAOM 197198]POG57883.1 hypothetical protein GLOIN_2v1886255 [Rhizophagus irregularis DAOM 181602=DAOM 197198]|eukprot:XP_025164749.1 hypothetical protein GLOIN_2v1886255 [Rhizophagus irregularis DAOM 181602=DAOM 197198]